MRTRTHARLPARTHTGLLTTSAEAALVTVPTPLPVQKQTTAPAQQQQQMRMTDLAAEPKPARQQARINFDRWPKMAERIFWALCRLGSFGLGRQPDEVKIDFISTEPRAYLHGRVSGLGPDNSELRLKLCTQRADLEIVGK